MFRVGQTIIIAGPSCAGKSLLIRKIRQGAYPRLVEQLGIADPLSCLYVMANKLERTPQTIIEQLIVHYDFYRQYSHGIDFKYLHELIAASDTVTILTLYVPQKVLIERINSRLLRFLNELLSKLILGRGKKDIFIGLKKTIRTWKKRMFYKYGFSERLYEKWFDFLAENSKIKHWVLNLEKSNIEIPCLLKGDIVESFIDGDYLAVNIK